MLEKVGEKGGSRKEPQEHRDMESSPFAPQEHHQGDQNLPLFFFFFYKTAGQKSLPKTFPNVLPFPNSAEPGGFVLSTPTSLLPAGPPSKPPALTAPGGAGGRSGPRGRKCRALPTRLLFSRQSHGGTVSC